MSEANKRLEIYNNEAKRRELVQVVYNSNVAIWSILKKKKKTAPKPKAPGGTT